jgi:uncharacterized membrane protein YbhN (UPF0104 family)
MVILALGLLALPLGYLIWIWRGGTPLTGWAARCVARFPRVAWLSVLARVVREAEGQVGTFGRRHPRTFIAAVIFSGLVWVGLTAEFWLALQFLGVDLTLPQVITVMTAARIANLFPTPGGLGTLEAGQVLVMEALGVNPAVGVGLSLIIRARDVAFGGLGLFFAGVFSPRMNFSNLEGER